MNNYIALLRGINVGGKNKVPMPVLREVFEAKGFLNVRSYINSGNIIFSSTSQNTDELKETCERLIAEKFGLTIPVTVVSAQELAETMAQAPSWWDADKEAVNYAIFMIPPMTTAEVIATLGEIKPAYEQFAYHGNVIFWSGPRATYNKTKYAKIASSVVNQHVTIRNANTTNKLLALVQLGEG